MGNLATAQQFRALTGCSFICQRQKTVTVQPVQLCSTKTNRTNFVTCKQDTRCLYRCHKHTRKLNSHFKGWLVVVFLSPSSITKAYKTLFLHKHVPLLLWQIQLQISRHTVQRDGEAWFSSCWQEIVMQPTYIHTGKSRSTGGIVHSDGPTSSRQVS